ncbi:MAG: hypothetical protein KDE19_25210 [Caldilineaceae bacterium]|nr:hypothetical protein [Caldilineaceae bacterium]
MELRAYWQIIRRRWWLPLVLTLAVALLSALQLRPWQTPSPTYSASMRFLIGVLPVVDADLTSYDARFYAWQTSEYLVDDFSEVVSSSLFAQQVSQRLAAEGIAIPAGAIRGSSATGRLHRILTLTLNWPNREELAAIADAVVAELQENSTFYFAQLGTENTMVTVLDQPTIGEVGQSLRARTEWPLRVVLALMVGIGVVFLLDYLDTSVRNSQDLELMGIPVVGMIPKQ